MCRFSSNPRAAFFLVLVSLAACTAPRATGSAADYLERRTEYAHNLTDQYNKIGRAVLPADSLALRALERQLRTVIGPLTIADAADTGRINLVTLLPGDTDSGLADGLLYQLKEPRAQLFVTTVDIFRGWLTSRFGHDSTSARDPLSALTHDDVYTPIFDDNSAVVRYASLPVSSSRGHVIAAMLIDRAQDYCLTCSPGDILISVTSGSRLFIIDAPARDTIPVPDRCEQEARRDDRAQRAVERDNGLAKRDSSLLTHDQAEASQFANLLKCYEAGARMDSRFSRLVAQAQALVERLPQ